MKKQYLIVAAFFITLWGCKDNKSSRADGLVGESSDFEEVAAEDAGYYEPVDETTQESYKNVSGSGVGTIGEIELANTTSYFAANDATSSNAQNNDSKVDAKRTNDKIIRTADIGLELDDFEKQQHHFTDLVKKFDGYVSNENERSSSSRVSNTITIRLPNKYFDDYIKEALEGEGIMNIDYKRVNAIDVGEEYTDVVSRIKTKKAVEQRYLDILKQAKEIKDILEVEEKLRVIREEIESKQGRLRYLQDRISYSTINLFIYQDFEYDAPKSNKPTFWGKMTNAADSGWNAILSFILFLVYIWPIILLLGFVVLAWRKKWFIFKKRQ